MLVFACAVLTAKPFTRLHVAPFGFGNVGLGNKCAQNTQFFSNTCIVKRVGGIFERSRCLKLISLCTFLCRQDADCQCTCFAVCGTRLPFAEVSEPSAVGRLGENCSRFAFRNKVPYAPFFSVPLRDVPRHVSTTAWQLATSGIKPLV